MHQSATSDAERTTTIQAAIREAERKLRARHPWLRHQDALGALLMATAAGGMLASGFAYAAGAIPAWLCIPLSAFFASVTHELEHDLIHWMYFRRRPWAHHLMLGVAWLARPSTINPWVRRELHFAHHKHSGTEADVEERAITNGERWGLARLLMTVDAPSSILLRALRAREPTLRRRILRRATLAYFPLGWLHWGLWWTFLVLGTTDLAFGASATASLEAWREPLRLAIVTWIAPNVLRSACLHFISSNMHYHGDVEPGDVIQQTQVLDAWYFWPANAFCFDFGGTHAIHHFVVPQPFYVRTWIAPQARRAMRDNGVRFNDLASLARANRWSAGPVPRGAA